jgi:hypothetical protein
MIEVIVAVSAVIGSAPTLTIGVNAAVSATLRRRSAGSIEVCSSGRTRRIAPPHSGRSRRRRWRPRPTRASPYPSDRALEIDPDRRFRAQCVPHFRQGANGL